MIDLIFEFIFHVVCMNIGLFVSNKIFKKNISLDNISSKEENRLGLIGSMIILGVIFLILILTSLL